jgi:urea transport system ATP-binding protein
MAAALTIDGLSVDFDGFKAVNSVSMIVDEGELRVLLGANGAGKTTLMDLISGKTKSTGGRVFLYDTEITNLEEHKIAGAGVGRKFQIPSVFKDLTVRRNLEVASCSRDTRVLANLGFGFSRAGEDRVDEVLELTGLTEEARTVAANLSHGQTQWLELGMLMVQNAKVLLLDEPTAGMTQAETLKTSKIINALGRGQRERDRAKSESQRSVSGIEGDQLMLKLVEVDSFYGRSHVLHGVNLDVPAGEITTILGRNGTGKTTLLKTIMGLTDRTNGAIRYDDRDIASEPTFRRARGGFAYVPQGREIIPDFTIRENILLGAFARADGKRTIPSLVPELFPYLIQNLDRRGGVLSGGQQQQLAIARALAAEPKILLLDEPTEGIQPNIVEEIEEVILRLNRVEHLTVLLVEQNVDFARRAARRFAIMEKGSVVAAGDIGELSDDLVHRHMAV